MRGNLKPLGIRPYTTRRPQHSDSRSHLIGVAPDRAVLEVFVAFCRIETCSRLRIDDLSTGHKRGPKESCPQPAIGILSSRLAQWSGPPWNFWSTLVHEWCTDGALWVAGCFFRNKQGFQRQSC
jgi:hypothetical protein